MTSKYKVEDFGVGDLFVANPRDEDIICEVLPMGDRESGPLYVGANFVHGNCIFGSMLGEYWVHVSIIGLRVVREKLMRR